MSEIIRVQNLEVGYGDEIVLEQLNFSVEKSEIFVILGPSGCGKTTVLKTILGLIPPISGDIYFFQKPMEFLSEKSMNRIYDDIGVLYQTGALLNSINLFDNIALPVHMHYPGIPEQIKKEMVLSRLSQVGLETSWKKYPSELSEGMKKRAALARALILSPKVICCDEPSAGLDPITASRLADLLLDLNTLLGITFVVITHELRSIEKIADKVLVLHNRGL
ncbi:MAG: ATP-binding cassette domain-containing protein, partial [Candidatus Aminicenantes bacterium]|nr:ATP-binding cassette domain-containing protein [Candidatus Aminicenantes bacterium]